MSASAACDRVNTIFNIIIVLVVACRNFIEPVDGLQKFATFVAVRNDTGELLCISSGEPSMVEVLRTKFECLFKCENTVSCVGFNWLDDRRSCEIYTELPTSYAVRSGCVAMECSESEFGSLLFESNSKQDYCRFCNTMNSVQFIVFVIVQK